MVSMNPAPPAVAKAGLKVVMVGAVGLIVKAAAVDMPTPPRVSTVMPGLPAVAIILAGTMTVNCVGLTYVVARWIDCHQQNVVELKFAPLIVIVNPAPPAAAEAGLRPVTMGGGWIMLKVTGADVPPAVLTVT
jgi:hypothetical protein